MSELRMTMSFADVVGEEHAVAAAAAERGVIASNLQPVEGDLLSGINVDALVVDVPLLKFLTTALDRVGKRLRILRADPPVGEAALHGAVGFVVLELQERQVVAVRERELVGPIGPWCRRP